jgi:hypothetical protein
LVNTDDNDKTSSPKEKLDKIGQPSRFPGFGIANFSLLAGKTSLVIVNKLGFVLNKWLVLPRLSNFVQFHWSPFAQSLQLVPGSPEFDSGACLAPPSAVQDEHHKRPLASFVFFC